MRHGDSWTRDHKIGLGSLVIGVLSVFVALLLPEVRVWLHIEKPAATPVIASVFKPPLVQSSQPATAPKPAMQEPNSELNPQPNKHTNKKLEPKVLPIDNSGSVQGNITQGPCSIVQVGGRNNQAVGGNCAPPSYGDLKARCLTLAQQVIKLAQHRWDQLHVYNTYPRYSTDGRLNTAGRIEWQRSSDLQFRTRFFSQVVKIQKEFADAHFVDRELDDLLRTKEEAAKAPEVNPAVTEASYFAAYDLEEIANRLDVLADKLPPNSSVPILPVNIVRPEMTPVNVLPQLEQRAGHDDVLTGDPPTRRRSAQQLAAFAVNLGTSTSVLRIVIASSADDAYPLAQQICQATKNGQWQTVCPTGRESINGNMVSADGIECYSSDWDTSYGVALALAMRAVQLSCKYFPHGYDFGSGVIVGGTGGFTMLIGNRTQN